MEEDASCIPLTLLGSPSRTDEEAPVSGPESSVCLCWDDLRVSVPSRDGGPAKIALAGVSGYARGGRLLAVMVSIHFTIHDKEVVPSSAITNPHRVFPRVRPGLANRVCSTHWRVVAGAPKCPEACVYKVALLRPTLVAVAARGAE